MATHQNHLSIVDAVETLSSIADLEFDRDIGITQKHERILGNEKIAYKTVHWLHEEDASSTVNLVRETFRVILHYLRQFYTKEYGAVTDQKTAEGIKTIMVLVGEAAKKLDKYIQLFHQKQSVTELKEYKQLQDFYRSKVARKIEEGVSDKWTLGLSLGKGKAPKEITFKGIQKQKLEQSKSLMNTQHVFVDLETVKKDSAYELFFIRKENGSRFFSPRLLRNIKLVCDFGSYFGEKKEFDLLDQIKQSRDRAIQTSAVEIVKFLGDRLDNYFRETRKYKEHELVQVMNKAIFALMLSSHSQNLSHRHPPKNCSEYFADFQEFLREALQSNIYQRWMVQPPKKENQLAFDLIDLIQSLCRAVFTHLKGFVDMNVMVSQFISESMSFIPAEQIAEMNSMDKISFRLSEEYGAMTKLMKRHSNGPLLKVLEIFEEDSFQIFDPLLQQNIPHPLFDLYDQDKRYLFLRMSSPVCQEFISSANISEEFLGFLRSYSKLAIPRKHLLINLQDRTSWREHARSVALEELQFQKEFENTIEVVTLAIDTDFYHQLTPYHQINHAHLFKEQFKELILDENGGYFFPSTISQKKLSQFIDGAFDAVHRFFFSSKNVLSRENRLDFIEIFYILLQLKLMEWSNSDSVSLTCKDGIDTGQTYHAGLFAFFKLMGNQKWDQNDWNFLNYLLYGPALLIRERIMLPDRFNRLLSALKVLENAREEHGEKKFAERLRKDLEGLFDSSIMGSQILLSK